MVRRRDTLFLLGCGAAIGHVQAQPAVPTILPQIGEIKDLGNDRFQVGKLTLDKRARRFIVPGRVQALDKPLEYLATTPTGRKAYETLLVLDTTGSELNLACILIGLERDPKVPSSRQLTEPGQPVLLSVAWTGASGQRRVVTAAEALLGVEAGKGAVVEWAYTGSFTSIDGSQLAADHTGTLVSFVKKDATGIIEAVSGMSLGPYGTVRGSVGLPSEGSAVELIVEAAPLKK